MNDITVWSIEDNELTNNFVTRSEAIRQMIQNRLQMMRDTWFLDITAGLDIPNIFYKTNEEVLAEVVANILSVNGIAQSENSVILTNEVIMKNNYDRTIKFDFLIDTIYNATIQIQF